MRKFFILLRYELNKIILSPSSYFVCAIFLSITGAIFLFMLREYVLFDQESSLMHAFFQCYWLPVLLSVPMLTMRAFSDDYKTGIMQVIKSGVVSDSTIVLAKFLATYLFYIILWSLTGLFIVGSLLIAPALLCDASFFDLSSIIGGYFYVCISGAMFISIGSFFSSLTENQILASMSTFVTIFLLFLNGQLLTFRGITGAAIDGTIIRPLNLFLQLDNACFGVFDSRVVILYLTLTFLFVVFAKISLEKKFC